MNIRKLVLMCFITGNILSAGGIIEAQSTDTIQQTGDVLKIAMPLAAYGMTYLFDDAPGRASLSWTVLSTAGATYILKRAIPRDRPGTSGSLSFVSGHTSSAFSAAAFVQRRYGWKYGLPAYLAAGFVGWSRVKAGKHYSDDVVRGAAVGILNAYLFTRPYKGNLRIEPFVENRTVGIALRGSW